MLKNITLSADPQLIENARRLARNENKTLNQLFRDWLEQYQAKGARGGAFRSLMSDLRYASTGKKKLTREEMNER
jgi:hypothetical protein